MGALFVLCRGFLNLGGVGWREAPPLSNAFVQPVSTPSLRLHCGVCKPNKRNIWGISCAIADTVDPIPTSQLAKSKIATVISFADDD